MPSWLTILCALLAVHLFALEALAERAGFMVIVANACD